MFTESVPTIYGTFRYCDTARDQDVGCNENPPDTGDSYNHSPYINFDYQFSSDSFFIKNAFDTNQILLRDLRPGYAGFKTAWDYGMTGFPMNEYKYLVFAHKGPIPAHKVTLRVWYNDGQCGSSSYNKLVGQFASSAQWKLDTIVIPDSIRNQAGKYYELVFIINNLNPGDTTSGPRDCLKIDDIRLVGYHLTNSTGADTKKGCGCGSGTGLALIPPLFFKSMAYRKRKKKASRP